MRYRRTYVGHRYALPQFPEVVRRPAPLASDLQPSKPVNVLALEPRTRIIVATTAISRKLDLIQQKSALRSVDIANVIGARAETVSKWNQGKALPRPDTQRRLLDLEYIVDLLSDLYEPDEVKLWLISRQKLLGGRVPTDLIHDGKTEDVIAVIDQIRDGVFV
jgi:hypothetical protein